MNLAIETAGWLLLPLAGIHALFPKYFDWKNDLESLSLINRQMMQVHTFFVALVVFLMGVLCVTSAHELTATIAGRRVSAGFAVFWGARFLVQFFWYSPALWKGKRPETLVHIVFATLWAGLTLIFGLAGAGAAS